MSQMVSCIKKTCLPPFFPDVHYELFALPRLMRGAL